MKGTRGLVASILVIIASEQNRREHLAGDRFRLRPRDLVLFSK